MTGSGTPLKAIQESAMEMCRGVMPALRRCSSFRNAGGSVWMPALAERRANRQQSENLKWQQDMFLRLINLTGLCSEGLIGASDVAAFRQKIIDNIVVCYDGGEYPQVTRDKLIFLQELLYAKCISEPEYHTVKKSLLYRLAAEGAEINSSDIVLTCSATPLSAPTSPLGRKRLADLSSEEHLPEAINNNCRANEELPKPKTPSKSPVKHFIEAMSRLKHGGKVHHEPARRVPHAMDFVKYKECPGREPPEFDTSDQCGSPLFHSPSGSVSSMESSSKRDPGCSTAGRYRDETSPKKTGATRTLFPASSPRQKSPLAGNSSLKPAENPSKVGGLLTDMVRNIQGEGASEQAEVKAPEAAAAAVRSETPKRGEGGSTTPKKPWRLDMLRPAKIVTSRQQENVKVEKKVEKTDSSLDQPVLFSPNRASTKAAPDTVKLKKKFQSKGASTDFFIDKVLGENIKQELQHIRSEMSKTNATQTFTNDQIDAIATRLPADKSELMRFFPKSWCDRYGDIVLDVVHKEFKGHIKEMEVSRKNTKEKRRENDENSGSTSNNLNCDSGTISKATSVLRTAAAAAAESEVMVSQSKNKAMNRCFTTSDGKNSPRSRARKVTSFNSSVGDYEKELDGKLCAEIEKMPPHRKTPLRV